MGGLTTIIPLYLSELAPPAIRGRILALYQWFICIGVLLAAIAIYFFHDDPNYWRYFQVWLSLNVFQYRSIHFSLDPSRYEGVSARITFQSFLI